MIMMVRAMQRKDRAERIANPNFVKIGGFRNAGSCVHSLCMHMHMESQNELVIARHVRRHDEEGSGAATAMAARPRRRRPVIPAAGQRAPDACLPPMQEPTNLRVCLLFSHVRLPAHGNTGSSLAGPGEAVSSPGVPTS